MYNTFVPTICRCRQVGKAPWQGGHGQRTSNLFSRQDFGEEVGVPAGDLHFAADAFFHRVML
jgi:hypothetical protein